MDEPTNQDSKVNQTFEIPIPQMPPLPANFVVPPLNFPPPQINLPPIVFTTPNIADIPSVIKLDPVNIPNRIEVEWGKPSEAKMVPPTEPQHVSSCRFDVTCERGQISEYVRAVTYRFKPQEITFVLNDLRIAGKTNPIFDWVHLLLYRMDDVVITTLDKNGLPIYQNEFLGCRLKEHHCPMDYSKNDVATHHITVTYEHTNINRIKRKESDA